MSVYGRILLAGLGSLLLLLGAFGFQYIGNLAPCHLCILQRWPHAAAIAIALAAITVGWRLRRSLAIVGAAAMAVSVGLAVYHIGVEHLWWAGPSSCTGIDPAGLTADQLLAQLQQAPLARCDEIAWDFLGVTMAGWNAIFSAGLAVLWVFAALPRTPTRHVAPEDRAGQRPGHGTGHGAGRSG